MRASRLLSVLMTLQARGRVSARVLAEELEVSVRTVYRDIDELSAAGVPVTVERGPTGGFELLDGWRTNLTGLTADEAQSLFVAGLPAAASDLGLATSMASAQLKLLAALPDEWQAGAQRSNARFHVDLAGWYRRTAVVEHLPALAKAVWGERWIAVKYESWKGVIERNLQPLGLVIKGGNWYFVALVHGGRRSKKADRSPRTYRVSNLRALTAKGSFVRPKGFDLGRYWAASMSRFERDLFSGTADIRVSPQGKQSLCGASAAVHAAVDLAAADPANLDAEGWLHVQIPTESIDHAARTLLAIGAEIEVIAPAELRQQMRATARAVAALYGAERNPASAD
jgi:predicted DNA-binding transcriptional regulator YafY